MPTTSRIPSTFTVTVGATQIELPVGGASVDVYPQTRGEFVTIMRGLATFPGATAPRVSLGIAALVTAGGLRFCVVAPRELRAETYPPVASTALNSAISDAAAVSEAAA